MNSKGFIVMALAVFGASAKPMLNSGFQTNGFNSLNGGFTTLPVVNTHIQGSVMENPSMQFQNYVPTNSITDSCHCLKTLVRPHIRNELIAVPAVDRVVQTVSSPVLQTVNCGAPRRIEIPSFPQSNAILSGVTGDRTFSEIFPANNVNFNAAGSSIFNGATTGTTFAACQGTNARGFNGASMATFNGGNGAILGNYPGSTNGVFPSSNTGILSGNAAFSNGARIGGF